MKHLLGAYLRELRGGQSRLAFAKSLGLSYTFVREMELGNRLPSDEVLMALGDVLQADQRRLLLFAYCDRSAALRRVLQESDVSDLIASVRSLAEADPE